MNDIPKDSEGIGQGGADAAVKVSDMLAGLLAKGLPATVSLGWLTERLHERSFGAYILLLGMIGVLPVASIPVGILIAIIAGQMVFGMANPALPGFIARKPIPSNRIAGPMRKVIAAVRRMEALIHPRWHIVCRSTHLIGLVIFLLALLLLIPIPFSNIVPALVISLISLAYTEKDGLLVAVGILAAILTAVVVPALILRLV